MGMPQNPLGANSPSGKKDPIKNQGTNNGSNPSSSSIVDDSFSSGSRMAMSRTSSQEPISCCSKFNKKRKHVQQVHQEISKKRTRKRDHNIIIINNDNSNEISTKLSLRDETWPTKEDTTQVYIPAEDMMRNQMLAYNIGLMKHYRPGEEEHESRIGVSTKLDLFTYPWSITKILTRSDLGHLSRLLVQTRLAERYVMPFLDEASRNEVIGNPEGLRTLCADESWLLVTKLGCAGILSIPDSTSPFLSVPQPQQLLFKTSLLHDHDNDTPHHQLNAVQYLLLVQTRLAERYVMPYLDEASRSEVIVNPEGLRVSVWDCDTKSMHCLVFKKWATSKSYVLINHWTKDFVRRRELAAGDEIGMCWGSFYSRFNFSVLKRASTIIIQEYADVDADHVHDHHQFIHSPQ
ncbi:hypothetical protein WN944_024972 [Citrus x changshan-huyou]|uniref:B3 domain-containing protein n=1 Tax=Citrus x changshan-huyou TaxID=2935761 RepID=A0AAP0LPM3_9ROSI